VDEIDELYVFISLQCGRQIAQLKEEYEETKKTLEEEASKLRQVSIDEILTNEMVIIVLPPNSLLLCVAFIQY